MLQMCLVSYGFLWHYTSCGFISHVVAYAPVIHIRPSQETASSCSVESEFRWSRRVCSDSQLMADLNVYCSDSFAIYVHVRWKLSLWGRNRVFDIHLSHANCLDVNRRCNRGRSIRFDVGCAFPSWGSPTSELNNFFDTVASFLFLEEFSKLIIREFATKEIIIQEFAVRE